MRIRGVLISWVSRQGSVILYSHMLKQRRKYLAPAGSLPRREKKQQ